MKYELNHYRSKQIGNRFLLTNDLRDFVVLNRDEFEKLLKLELNQSDSMFSDLVEKGFILTDENSLDIEGRFRKKNAHLFRGTSLHIMIPTLRCNFDCVYCHAKTEAVTDKGQDMDNKTAEKIVDFIFQSPSESLSIEFQGGEPLLNFDVIKHVVNYANNKKDTNKTVMYSIVSNLSLLDEEKLDFILKNKISLCTSLDGPQNVHDKNRTICGVGTYTKVVENIEKAKKKGVDVNALLVTTKNSLSYPKEIVEEYVKHGFDRIQLKPLTYLTKAVQNWNEIGYEASQFLKFYKEALDYIIELNHKGEKVIESLAYYILVKIFTDRPSIFVDLQSPCGAIIGQLAYNFNGDIFTCDEGRCFEEFKLGNVADVSYSEVTTSDTACNMISLSSNENFLCDNCVYKSYCGLCPVCNYSETGSMVTNVGTSNRCKIFKGMFDIIFEKIINDEKALNVLKSWVK